MAQYLGLQGAGGGGGGGGNGGLLALLDEGRKNPRTAYETRPAPHDEAVTAYRRATKGIPSLPACFYTPSYEESLKRAHQTGMTLEWPGLDVFVLFSGPLAQNQQFPLIFAAIMAILSGLSACMIDKATMGFIWGLAGPGVAGNPNYVKLHQLLCAAAALDASSI